MSAKHLREAVNDVLAIKFRGFIQMDCLQLAAYCDCQNFVAHRISQKALEESWCGYDLDAAYELVYLCSFIYEVFLSLKQGLKFIQFIFRNKMKKSFEIAYRKTMINVIICKSVFKLYGNF